jgi:hypothetical protein
MLVLTRLLVCSATVALAACGAANGSLTTEPPCAADLSARIAQPELTLGLGDSARLVAMAYRCLGTIPVAATWQWSVLDTSIVRVDAASGWVVARREGETQVVARGAAPISVSTTARVTVRR